MDVQTWLDTTVRSGVAFTLAFDDNEFVPLTQRQEQDGGTG